MAESGQPQAAEGGQPQAADPDAMGDPQPKPDTPRGVVEVQAPRGGPETYLQAIVSKSARHIRQVISGMSDAEVFQVVGQRFLPQSQGMMGSYSQDGQPPAADSGQLQAAGEVVANAPEEELQGEEQQGPACVVHQYPPELPELDALQLFACQSELAGGAGEIDFGGIRVP